jgi:hypothetical protein
MASRKPVTVSKEVVVAKAPQVPATFMARFKALAEKQSKGAANLGGGSSFVSLKAGNITINSRAIPGNSFAAVVLGYLHERAYYEAEYDASSAQAPDCYAFGELNGGAPRAPHDKAKDKLNDKCADCQYSKFGSARRGRGQACREGIKIAFVTADTDLASFEAQPIYMMRVPPTSIKFFKSYLDELGAEEMATSMVQTTIYTEPDNKAIFTVHFDCGEMLDKDRLAIVAGKLDDAEARLVEPYPDFEEDQPAPAKGGKNVRAKYR